MNISPWLIGAGVGSNVLGAIMNARAQGQANNQSQMSQDRLYDLAESEQARRDQLTQAILPLIGKNLGSNAISQLGASFGQIGRPQGGTAYTPSSQAQQQSGPGLGSKIGGAALSAGAGMLPSILAAGGSKAAPAIAGGFLPTFGATGGGLGATMAGLATNPFTIAGAGALGAGLLWRNSQAHHKADDWVQGNQNPFDQSMAQIDKAGMSPEEAQRMKQQNAQSYLNELMQFAQKGGREAEVARNAARTFRQYYGDPMQYGVQLPF